MALVDIDQTLARFHAEVGRVGGRLVDLEGNAYWKFIQAASLVGESALRRSEANRAFADTWEWFGRFKDLLEEAAQIRGTRTRPTPDDETRLESILKGPFIEIASDRVRASDRHLLSGFASTTTRCTPDELLALMSAALGRADSIISIVGQAWDGLLPRLRAAEARLEALKERAHSLGADLEAEHADTHTRIGRLRQTILTDPLVAKTSELDEIEAALDLLDRELLAADQLRADVASHFERAHALMDELRGAARTEEMAHSETRQKIASPNVPQPIGIDLSIVRQLSRAEALSNEGKWPLAQRELADWERRAGELLRQLRENIAANQLPIEERNQLRGRLDAYHAKAQGLGLAENQSIAALYEAARTALFIAPADLREAAELVRQYQDAISQGPNRKVAM